MNIKQKTYDLIDDLKGVCQNYGLNGDGNEYKIITQVFLYKFLNDKFGYEVKRKNEKLAKAEKWEEAYCAMSDKEREDLLDKLSPDILQLQPHHLVTFLWNNQTKGDFDVIFDSTMIDIAEKNKDIFSTHTAQNTTILLFEKLTTNIEDDSQKAPFARALVDKLVTFSFEEAFCEKYDFFAAIFEYLIKDYNTAGGGKYAEYYTPHAIAVIMARLLVGENSDLHNIECYDPSAGTGTLLMALAHQIGEDRATIFSQDISQKSNKMLKLNLIINGLVASLDNAVQGDTLADPYHKSDDGTHLKQFDFIVSNPPFNVDFSETRDDIAAMASRFWAGVPSIPQKDKSSMAIYTCFLQHVINSLKDGGKAAIVVPTPFLTKGKGIDAKIRKYIIDNHMLKGIITMPTNIFSTTGTNVSVVFLEKNKNLQKAMFVEASILGSKSNETERNQKTVLSEEEVDRIISAYLNKKKDNGFSIEVSYDDIIKNDYRLSPNTYFEHMMKYDSFAADEFGIEIKNRIDSFKFYYSKELEEILSLMFNRWFVEFEFPYNGKPYKSSGGELVYDELLEMDIPKGWKAKRILDVCDVVDCLHSKKPEECFESEEYYLMQLENLTPEGRIDVTNKYYISEQDYNIWSAKIEVHEGDFIVTNAGRTGAIGMIPEGVKCAIGRNMTAIRANEISPYYIRQFLYSPYMDKFLAANLDEGAFFKSFNVKSIKKIIVLMPDQTILDNYLKMVEPLLKKVLNGINPQQEREYLRDIFKDYIDV